MKGPRTIFLTGVTGTLGKELLKAFLVKTDARIFVLCRSKKKLTHWERIRKILGAYGLEKNLGGRVLVMAGDITENRFGLSPEDWDVLHREVTEFFHIAALTALNGSEADCTQINLEGTVKALHLAASLRRSGRLEKFHYFSTAYVAGSLQSYCSLEDELPRQPAHANFYESSKYLAEMKVREAMAAGLPAIIYRPSIVVGNSETGEVSEFNVIYPFLKLFAHGILTLLPTRPDNTFNIVPIDFVVNATLVIAQKEDSPGRTFHLVTQTPPTIGMLLDLKDKEFLNLPPIRVIDPGDFDKDDLKNEELMVYEMLEPYLGYLNGDLRFDCSNTEKALAGSGVCFPQTDTAFLRVLCQYAFDTGYLIK